MVASLKPHELQHARLPCPSLSPRVYSNSCPLSWWCHSTILSSVAPLLSCPQSFSASGSFPMSQLFASGGQIIGASVSISISPSSEYSGWFLLGLTSLISLKSKGLSIVFSSTTMQKHHSLVLSLLCGPTLISVHDDWKNHSFEYTDLC